jgi:hypothetical protein
MAERVKGIKGVRRELRKLARNYPAAAVAALYQEGVGIFNESQNEVPVDTGKLRQSGGLTVRGRGNNWIVFVFYGTKYALRIHEDTKLDANRQDPSDNRDEYGDTRTRGKSKYLADPFARMLPGVESRLVARIKRMMKMAPRPESLPDLKGKAK